VPLPVPRLNGSQPVFLSTHSIALTWPSARSTTWI